MLVAIARYPPQLVELERLRRELAYRKQLNEQQNNMIAQQRAQLSMGKEEMSSIDDRIVELQARTFLIAIYFMRDCCA